MFNCGHELKHVCDQPIPRLFSIFSTGWIYSAPLNINLSLPLRKLSRRCTGIDAGKRTERNSVSLSLHKIIRTSGIPGSFMADPYDSLQASRYLLRALQLRLCSTAHRNVSTVYFSVGVTSDRAG